MPELPHKCSDCAKRFTTRRACYLHWLSVHYRNRLGVDERTLLDDMEAAREEEERRKREAAR